MKDTFRVHAGDPTNPIHKLGGGNKRCRRAESYRLAPCIAQRKRYEKKWYFLVYKINSSLAYIDS